MRVTGLVSSLISRVEDNSRTTIFPLVLSVASSTYPDKIEIGKLFCVTANPTIPVVGKIDGVASL